MKNFETVYLENQNILIDKDAEIKVGDWICSNSNNGEGFRKGIIQSTVELGKTSIWDKVIATSPKLGDLPLLPLPDDSVKVLAIKYADEQVDKEERHEIYLTCIKDFIAGYKSVKANTFTKEDMEKAMEAVYHWFVPESGLGLFPRPSNFEALQIKWLQLYLDQKPKPQFIPEMEQYTQNYHKDIWYDRIKIVGGVICGRWK